MEQIKNTSFVRPEIVRPPSEGSSYFLPLTHGCSNNTCTFCHWYGSKLSMRAIEEVKQEIDAMSLYMKHHIQVPGIPQIAYAVMDEWDGKRVFLQDGDAMVYPQSKLNEVLDYLNDRFPYLERVASYATPMDILRRSVNELATFCNKKLQILYMGIESGDDIVLQNVGKGVTHAQIVEAGEKVKQAGILLSVTVILGLGGIRYSVQHVSETAKILTEIDPNYAGALTLTLRPGTPLYDQWKQGTFSPISPFDSLHELKTLIAISSFTHCFFSSMHASNYVALRGYLPESKEMMLRQLNDVLESDDVSLLRPEFLRGL